MPQPTSRSGSRPTPRLRNPSSRATNTYETTRIEIMSTANQSKDIPKKVLITGASGLLGVAAIERFLDAGWEVVGVSRRKPALPSGRNVDFLSVDLRDQDKTRAAFEPLTDVTHIAYT